MFWIKFSYVQQEFEVLIPQPLCAYTTGIMWSPCLAPDTQLALIFHVVIATVLYEYHLFQLVEYYSMDGPV